MSRVKLGLIGDNIARSKSPRLHRTAGALTGLDVTYDRLIPKDLGQTFDEAFAQAISAVNTVLFKSRSCPGANSHKSELVSANLVARRLLPDRLGGSAIFDEALASTAPKGSILRRSHFVPFDDTALIARFRAFKALQVKGVQMRQITRKCCLDGVPYRKVGSRQLSQRTGPSVSQAVRSVQAERRLRFHGFPNAQNSLNKKPAV